MPSFVRDSTNTRESELVGASIFQEVTAPAFVVTAGVATYTAENLLRGVLKRDPAGASRADVLPTAALIVAAVAAKYGSAKVGDIIDFTLINDADAAETITLTLGAGMTSGNAGTQFSAAIGQNISRRMLIRLTNVTAAAEACVIYA